ncbi:hypothetical protein ACHAXT_009489 [Thalassiosira profunda]
MTGINQPPPPSRGSLSRSRAHRLRPPFSLTVAGRALAASTVAYLEPHARGLKFAAYDGIVKQTLLPPFSEVAAKEARGRDISKQSSLEQEGEAEGGGEQSVDQTDDVANTTTSQSSHIRVYTLGCPRVGNVKFAEAFNTLVPDCWNVLNDNDIVPGIPYSPKIVRSRLPAICPCKETGYKRHGRAVILKDNGTLVVDPSRWIKYRREAKTLRLKRAVDSHKTSSYREHIRAAIRNDIDEESRLNMPTSRDHLDNEAGVGVGLKEVNDLLERLGDVIGDALSDPNRSIRLLPGAT